MIASGSRRVLPVFNRTFGLALTSAVLYWGSFPPLKLSFLIWVVPVLWTCLIRQSDVGGVKSKSKHTQTSLSSGRSGSSASAFYLKIWGAGLCFWLLYSNWMCQPPFSTKAFWLAVSFLLAFLWVLFIGLTRVAVHGMRIPVIVAGPIVWCGLEWFRKNCIFGGLAYASLEHTQYQNVTIIQIADIFGEYGVGMFIVFVGTCIGRLLPIPSERPVLQSPAARVLDSERFAFLGCVIVFLLVVLYGRNRLSAQEDFMESRCATPRVKIALLQGNISVTAFRNGEMAKESFEQYKQLSRQAAPSVDLIVWPEASCIWRLYSIPPTFVPKEWKDESKDAIEAMLQDTLRENHERFVTLARDVQTPLLLGVETSSFGERDEDDQPVLRRSAVLVDPETGVGPRYDKVKLIPFAEYNPLAPVVQVAYASHLSLTSGNSFPAFPIRYHRNVSDEPWGEDTTGYPAPRSLPLWAAVHICYDGSFPHVVRRQMRAMIKAGKEPDVLINLTDVGLFGISSPIDMHFATHVFRAIENRKQYLVAANAGYSSWIDSRGRIVKRGERGAATYIIAEVYREPTESLYLYWGDAMPMSCTCFNVFLAVSSGWRVIRRRRVTVSPSAEATI